jgi:hypothetical protein
MNYPKPGPKQKSSKIHNKSKTRIHDIEKPSDKKCRRCEVETGTEAYRHLESFRKYMFGKGMAKKCDDHLTAWLCSKCTEIMDRKPDKFMYADPMARGIDQELELLKGDYEVMKHSEEWLFLVCKTWLV